MIPFSATLGNPSLALQMQLGLSSQVSRGPHGPPFVSQLILHSNDLLSSLPPTALSYLRKKHILFMVIYLEPAHNTCMYLQMFNSPVEWFARDFKQESNLQTIATNAHDS